LHLICLQGNIQIGLSVIAPEESAIELSTQHISIDGYPVQYQTLGDGFPILLVHGLSGSTRWWIRNIPALADHYRVYLVDLPGFGAMHRYPRPFVLSEAITWLLRWMEVLELRQCYLVGHSMGGYMCLWIAAHHPELVRRLVLVAPTGLPLKRSLVGSIRPLLRASFHTSPSFWPILMHDALRAGPLTLLQAGEELLSKDIQEDLKSIQAPTLLIWGDLDRLVPPSLSATFLKEIADARLLILKKAGHVPMFDRAKEFNEALLTFLTEDELGRSRNTSRL
jgi:pimeloyl-ACP methyl ester carboxylesterase